MDVFAAGTNIELINGWSMKEDRVAAVFSLKPEERSSDDCTVITFSQNGMVKRSLASDLPTASSQAFTLCKINPDDSLIGAFVSLNEAQQIMLFTEEGMAIRFDQADLRPMGLIAAGVNGIKLKGTDRVSAAVVVDERDFCCLATSDWGLGKIPLSEFPKQGRYGQGVKAIRLNPDEKLVGAIKFTGGKSNILIRYGNNKARQVRPAMVKQVKRTRFLEYFIKLINHKVVGLDILPMEKLESAEKKEPEVPAEKPKKPRAKKVKPIEEPRKEDLDPDSDQTQYSLF